MATNFPQTLLPSFSYLTGEVSRLNSSGALSKMEYCTLVEGLIIISNQLGNHDRQAMFLSEILRPVLDQFRQLESSYCDPLHFMQFVGLTSAPATTEKKPGEPLDEISSNRSCLMTTINMILAVARRSDLPTDLTKAQTGGFTAPLGGSMVIRNPAGSLVCSVLTNVLLLSHTLTR